MMKEEKKIKDTFGNGNHFQVPAGYFDQLADQIMAQIPEQKAVEPMAPSAPRKAMKVSLWNRLAIAKVAAAVAAAVVLLGGGVMVALQHSAKGDVQMAHSAGFQATYSSGDDSFDQMADYAMMDSQDCYAQLVAEN